MNVETSTSGCKGKGGEYDKLVGLLEDVNAVEILDGLWIARFSEDYSARKIMWRLLSCLGDDDRAFVINLGGPDWFGYNLAVRHQELVPPSEPAMVDRVCHPRVNGKAA